MEKNLRPIVILSEGAETTFLLSKSANQTQMQQAKLLSLLASAEKLQGTEYPVLCYLAEGNQVPLLAGFFDRIGNAIAGFYETVAGTAGGIVQGAGGAVQQIASDPNALVAIGGAAAGVPIGGLGRTQPQNQFIPGQDINLNSILSNPVVLIGGLAALYFITKK